MMDQVKQKISIQLEQYNVQQDIELRLFLKSLNPMEINVLKEIIDNSLMIPIESFSEYFEMSLSEMLPLLKKMLPSSLFVIDGDTLVVNKEMRKRIETEILKFEESFNPDISYFLMLLNKLPIELLPTWYSIPKFSENISHSILKKIFITPKTYEAHLKEIHGDNPILHKIVNAIVDSPTKKMESSLIKKQFNLQETEFHQCIIHLEFCMACCLTYETVDGHWVEYVTLCNEWQQYLNWKKNKGYTVIDEDSVVPLRRDDFGFINDLTKLLKHAKEHPVLLHLENEIYHLPIATVSSLFTDFPKDGESVKNYSRDILEFCIRYGLCTTTNSTLHVLPQAEEWLSKSTDELGILLHRLIAQENIPNIERNLIEIERSLEPISNHGWIYFDEYISGLITPIGNAKPVQLIKVGNKWSYSLPFYDANDKELISLILCKRLFQSGIIAIGTLESKTCFRITPFGKSILGL